VLAKVPVEHQAEVKAAYWALFDDTATSPGEEAIAVVRGRADRFVATYAKRFPSAVDCVMSDFATLTTYLRFPVGHHARIRHSNFIERTFGETRRRVKVIGRLPGERTCLGLVWAVLDRASRGWRGVVMTPVAVRQLQDLRRQLFNPTTAEGVPTESAETVTAAA
jgi:putative transposase